jgi:hypothetical protein
MQYMGVLKMTEELEELMRKQYPIGVIVHKSLVPLIKRSGEVYLLCDGSKLNRRKFAEFYKKTKLKRLPDYTYCVERGAEELYGGETGYSIRVL